MIPVGTRVRIPRTDGVAVRLHGKCGEVTGHRHSPIAGDLVEVTLDGPKEDKPWQIDGCTWGLSEDQIEVIK